MKIVFICGSAQPGKDGVGDYVRLLAVSLIKMGHQAAIVAYNDKFVSVQETAVQDANGFQIPVLRLPINFPENKKLLNAGSFIDDFTPDWVSLQFVPFSFNKRGLSINLISHVKQLSHGRKLHIMFHELWVGMDLQSSLKLKLWGKLQKQLIKSMLRQLKPNVIHTHSQVYREQLSILGHSVKILALFGNIPLGIMGPKFKDLSPLIFGGIHHGGEIKSFLNWLKDAAFDEEKNIHFHFVGNNGVYAKAWHNELKDAEISYTEHGIQAETYISELLTQCTFGVGTTPYLLAEKSGSVAAMLEHGLPVAVVAREWVPIEKPAREISDLKVVKWHRSLNYNMFLQQAQQPYNGVEVTTNVFLNDLKL